MASGPPKSALEIALERLRKQDEAEGTTSTPLTEEQKAAIAEARSICEAKIAERKILYQSALATTFDPAARAALEEEYRRDIERYAEDRDRKIAKIRSGR